ncbi:MAG: TetR/AcrR family transcriptional regulator [Thermodesulfobacteriota bacterium]
MECKWERARSCEQKEHRVKEIISATERLYKKHPYEEITFVSIAKEANFTRSNLYKYFSSKEEIFLEFLMQDFVKWRKDLVRSFDVKKKYKVKEFAQIWTKVLIKNKRLLELVSIMFIHLERNVCIESFMDFKFGTKDEVGTVVELLCSIFPKLSPENSVKFIYLQMGSAVGLSQMTDYNEMQLEAFKHPELCYLKAEFKPLYENSVEYMMNGLLGSK